MVGLPRKVTPCGTLTAYNRHRRNGEPACEACLEAKREDRARRVAEQRAEQAAAAAEVREAMTPEDDMLALLREQRDVLRSHTISEDTPPSAVAGLSKQLVAILEQIDELERSAAKKTTPQRSSGSGSAPGGLGDLAARRAERERRREAAAGS